VNWISVIKKCIGINTNDINYLKEYIHEHKCTDIYLGRVLSNQLKKTLCLIKNDASKYSLGKKKKNEKDFYLSYAGTVNQFNAIKPIAEKFEHIHFLSNSTFGDIYLYKSLYFIISWFTLPILIFKYFSEKKNREAHNLSCFINDRFSFHGQFILFVIILKRMNPKAVIVANDHSPGYRLMKEACKILKMPILYIQHASVTEKFPKLDFHVSLLEGKDALNKYKLKGIEGDVHLVGMPKFDSYYQDINTNKSIKNIGLSLNILDSEESIENLLREISKADFKYQLTIRPHPRDKRHVFFERMVEQYDCKISDSRLENSFEFLKKIDLNIACESSIHLEATLMNVYPVYYKFSNEVKDNYGFIRNNLITDVIVSPKELISRINSMKNNKPNVRNRSEYYVSTVNSEYDGKSSELVKEIITNYFEN